MVFPFSIRAIYTLIFLFKSFAYIIVYIVYIVYNGLIH